MSIFNHKPCSKSLIKSNMSRNISVAKPFCKVCKDAGKTEVEYSSHFVKSEPGVMGIVVCPTLLAQACTYCHRTGHTVGYCEALKKQQKIKNREQRIQNYESERVKIVEKKEAKPVNRFALLSEKDESKPIKVVSKPIKVEQFPVLREIVTKTAEPVTVSYANMAAKPAKAPIIANSDKSCVCETYAISAPTVAEYVEKAYYREIVKKNWADWSDSDEE